MSREGEEEHARNWAENGKEISWHTCAPGPSCVLVNRIVCSSPWGLPASPGTKWDSEGKGGW